MKIDKEWNLYHRQSQEVVRDSLFEHFVAFARGWVVLDVGLLEIFVDIHNGSQVTAAVAVVRG